jgi:hypothetical protein
VICAVATIACGGDKSSSPSTLPSTVPSSSSATFAFRASPIALSAIEFIAPLGNLNPPDHTLPTDHIYLYHRLNNQAAPPRTVVAPADGTVQTIINHNSDVKLLIKGASSGGALGVVGQFGVPSGSVPPRDVSPTSGKVAYRLFQAGGNSTFGSQVGLLIVQMAASDRVQAEYIPGSNAVDVGFSSASRIYVR